MSKHNKELDEILSRISPGVDAEDKPVYLELNDYAEAKAKIQALLDEARWEVAKIGWGAVGEITYVIDIMTTGDRESAINSNQQKLVDELLKSEEKLSAQLWRQNI